MSLISNEAVDTHFLHNHITPMGFIACAFLALSSRMCILAKSFMQPILYLEYEIDMILLYRQRLYSYIDCNLIQHIKDFFL